MKRIIKKKHLPESEEGEFEFEFELLGFPELRFAIALTETDRYLQLGTNSALDERNSQFIEQTFLSTKEFIGRKALPLACTHHRSMLVAITFSNSICRIKLRERKREYAEHVKGVIRESVKEVAQCNTVLELMRIC